jgi:23S rRNA (pseudouridine1915-N3)-methyltransferase
MFVIGGPYGFAARIRSKAHAFMSLGPMTFSHQIIRPFAAEQIYRAHTILKGEPYHHE